MDIFAGVKGLLTGKRGIDRISLDDLRKERVRLGHIEEQIASDIETLEGQKIQLFTSGKDEPTRRSRLAAARKIKELDAVIKGKDRQMAMISRQMRIISGLTTVKENQSVVDALGVSGIISKMDIDSLKKYVERATVEGKFEMEKFAGILKAMEEPEGLDIDMSEDPDTLAIMEAMQEAKKEEESDPGAVKRGMKKVDELLHSKENAEEELMDEDY